LTLWGEAKGDSYIGAARILSADMRDRFGNARRSRRGIGRMLAVSAIVVIVIAAVGVAAYYLYFNPSTSGGIGTSSIQLAESNGTVAAGGTTSFSYTVALASGTKWGTSLQVSNADTLGNDGITATVSTAAMDPPYSGTLTIAASSSAAPGTYQIVLKATGDDPSTTDAIFTLTVTTAGSMTSSSTTSSTTVSTTSTYSYGY
jgi:hypothetical protein